MYCGKCGNEIKENQKFCGSCGAEVLDTEFELMSETNGFNTAASIDFQKPEKKNKKKIIIPIFSVLVVVSLVIGGFSFVLQEKNKWYCAETKTIIYSDGKKEKTTVLSQRSDGQPTSDTVLNEYDELSSGRKYAYDDEGRVIRISFFDDGENIGVIKLNYEKEDEIYVAESTEIIDDIELSIKRIYNKKNVLIYESIETGKGDDRAITEKEYNDKGQVLKTHSRYRVFANIYNDDIVEYKYEKGRLASVSIYDDNELRTYTEYDKNENIVKEESYSSGTLASQTVYDWSNSKLKNKQNIYGIGGKEKAYNGDGKLLYEINSKLVDDTVEMYIEFYDDETREEFNEYSSVDENEPYITAVLNDKKLIKEVYYSGKKTYEYKYDKDNNLISTKYYSDGELYQVTEYKWAKK